MKGIEYSVVIPIYNEEENIIQLNKEIKLVMDNISKNYEIIYINDGSSDNSLNELQKLKNVIIVNLNKNYGQATALDAGFKISQGKIVISMDGDLQNDPKDIPQLLEKLKKDNLDVVCGWRKDRQDKGGIKILTHIGRFLRKILINDEVHDTGCTLRVYKREAIKAIDIQGEMHRYILAILKWKGFRIGEIVVNHRPRIYGKTKYGYSKAIRGFIDLIYIWFIQKYSQRPLHIFGLLGLISFISGFLIELWMFEEKLMNGLDLSANGWFILGFFMMVMGIMFFSFGMIIDLLIKIQLKTSPNEKRYHIREIIRK
ncbi:MAG TPA: glycosyltransferase family 2 protein [Candidatus Nanoarchaeia archaeon]|nr:glycosyltransferase family 2 protein [Candidatus Nanoarchaeia archaeon]